MECVGDSNKSAKGIVQKPCRTLKLPKPTPPKGRCELAAVYYSANSIIWQFLWLFRTFAGCSITSYIIIQGAKLVDFFHTPKGNTEKLRTHDFFRD